MSIQLELLTCVSNIDVLKQRLAASPCLQHGNLAWSTHFNCQSAAQAFNRMIETTPAQWLVWVHQDVYLPIGWEHQMNQALNEALQRWPNLAVAGVYGVRGAGQTAVRAGHVLDRGQPLKERTTLPYVVDSLDELLVAVRVGTGLRMDPDMGFDFYATDLVLQAQAAGWCAATLDAYCEHWSDTPTSGRMPQKLIDRVKRNGAAFETKWQHRLPLQTPCFAIAQLGDVTAFVDAIAMGDQH